jgi:hypothetical protein
MRENASNSALALGSAATPSLKFTGDTNTGIYSPGADQVAISTNGTGRLFVDASGRIGVGRTPVAYGSYNVLDLAGSAGSIQKWVHTGSTVELQAYASATLTAIGSATNHPFVITTNDTERLRITNAGLVGVGNSAPGSLLDIGSGSSAGVTQLTLKGGSTAGDYGIISIQNGSTQRGRIVADATFDHLRIDTAGGASTKIQFKTGASYTDAVTIDASQRVGIGTTSPTAKLEVAGGNIRLDNNQGVEWGGVNNYIYGNESTDFIAIATNGNERSRIDSSGKLLVGTSTARSNLFNNIGITPTVQLETTGNNARALSLVHNSNDDAQSFLVLGKSRGTAAGSATVVSNNDLLGAVSFQGADGSELVEGARIQCEVDGTPGANDMPGRLVFSTTADGAASPTERMRITSTGQLRLAGAGITFNGDTAAANELDDYEEGTWTPNQGSGLTVVGTFVSSGTYTKIGRQLFISGQMSATTIAVAAGGIISTNLPFSTTGYGAGGVGNFTLTNGAVIITASLSIYSVAAVGASGGIEFAATCIV